jgi:hypothetical protein
MVFKIVISKLAEIEIIEAIEFYESRKKGIRKRFFCLSERIFKNIKNESLIICTKKERCFRELPLKKFPFVII